MKSYILTDLIDLKTLQRVQDSFSKYTGLAAITIDAKGEALTSPSGFTCFCSNLIRKSPLGRSRCEKCDKNGALASLRTATPAVYTCHAGLIEYSAPILVDGEFLGAFVGGQIFPEQPDLELMKSSAEDLNIDFDQFLQQAKSTNIRSQEEVQKAARFIQEIATVLSSTALKNYNNQMKNLHLEQLSRSQIIQTSELSRSLKTNMASWTLLLKQALSTGDVEKIHQQINRILEKEAEISSVIEDSLGFIESTNGKVDLSETVWEVRDVIQNHVNRLGTTWKYHKLNFNCTISDTTPQKLFGDSARICQLITKLFMFTAMSAKKGSLNLYVTSQNYSYSKDLILQIADKSESISREKLVYIKNYMKYGNTEGLSSDELKMNGLPVIKQLVKHLNGKLEINEYEDNHLEFVVRIPQLEVRETEA